jgi:hypothetical protein
MNGKQWITSTHFRRAVLAICILFPLCLIAILTRHGIAIEPDSTTYLSAARSFVANGTLTQLTGGTLTVFPPGLPLALAIFGKLGLSMTLAATFLNLASASLMVLAAYFLTKWTVESELWGLATALLVGFSYVLVGLFSYLVSEPLFTAATLVVLLQLVWSAGKGAVSWRAIVVIVVACNAAVSFRYIGLVLIPTGALSILLIERRRGLRSLIRAAITAAASSIGLVAIVIRNLSLDAGPFGYRRPSGLSVLTVGRETLTALGSYLVPIPDSTIQMAVGVVILLLFGFGAWRTVRERRLGLGILLIYVIFYWISLWYSEFNAYIDPIGFRFLAPVMVPFLVVVVFSVKCLWLEIRSQVDRRFSKQQVASTERWLQVACVGLTTAVIAIAIVVEFPKFRESATDGLGYTASSFEHTALANDIRGLPSTGYIAASDPYGVYWLTGRIPILPIPPNNASEPKQAQLYQEHQITSAIEDGNVHWLVYFSKDNAVPMRVLLRGGYTVTRIAHSQDGDIYRVRRT